MTVATAAVAGAEPERRSNPLAWVSAALSSFVVSANLSVMSVAFDDLRTAFPDTKLSVLGWVLSIYTIVFGALLVPAGRLADRIGRRTVFMWGLVVFSAASMVAGLAPEVWLIIAGRIGQGAGAAMLVPSTLGLLLDAVAPSRRASATAFFSINASLGGVLGPTVGGVLVDQGGWRWAFFIAPIVAMASWLTGWRSLPRSTGRAGARLPDAVGAVLVVVGLTSLSLGILEARDWGWTDPRIVGVLALAAACVPVFVWRSRRHPVPVLPLQLTHIRSFTMANIASALYGMATGALLFSSVLFLREVWGYSILASGSGILPLALAATLMSLVVGRLGMRFGERAVGVPGVLIVALGLVWCVWQVQAEPGFWGAWVPGFAIIGMGMGLTYPMIGAACVREVDTADLSVAAASNRTTLQIGNAIGIALVIAILGDAVGAEALDRMRVSWLVLAALAVAVAVALAGVGRAAPVSVRPRGA